MIRRLDLDRAGTELPRALPQTLYAWVGDLVLPLLIFSVWLGVVVGAHA
ncbi:hypothetical protein [Limibacillus sp. MBR-115]|nr:hypothetical protein [uncultured Roseovarius sp.]